MVAIPEAKNSCTAREACRSLPPVLSCHFFLYTVILLLGVQIFTGLILACHYLPVSDLAFSSIRQLTNHATGGWWLRGLHFWAGHLLVGCAIVLLAGKALASIFSPRRLTASLVLLFLVQMALLVTGDLLRWNRLSHARSGMYLHWLEQVPLFGSFLTSLVTGTGDTLHGFYFLHVLLLPWISALFMLWVWHGRNRKAVPVEGMNARHLRFSSLAMLLCALLIGLLLLVMFHSPPLGTGDSSPLPGGVVKPLWPLSPLGWISGWFPGYGPWKAIGVLLLAGAALLLPWWRNRSATGKLSGWLLLVAIGCSAAPLSAETVTTYCSVCHGKEAQQLGKSVHQNGGLSCTGCHGGDPEAREAASAHAADKKFVGRPAGKDVVDLCGSCHGDVVKMKVYRLSVEPTLSYKTSQHGLALYRNNDPRVATCVSCHGVHEILSPNDPRSPCYPTQIPVTCGKCHSDPKVMEPYRIPSKVGEEYAGSVHGKCLQEGNLPGKAPHCVSCHGSHGAIPPGVAEIENVCGQCHARAKSAFQRGPHHTVASLGQMRECVSCHGNHAVALTSLEFQAGGKLDVCVSCHAKGDSAWKQGDLLRGRMEALRGEITSLDAELDGLERGGLQLEEERHFAAEARQYFKELREESHALGGPELESLCQKGTGALEACRELLAQRSREFRDRKVIGFIMIGILGLAFAGLAICRWRTPSC